jgi:hypothetical protein
VVTKTGLLVGCHRNHSLACSAKYWLVELGLPFSPLKSLLTEV